MLQVKNTKMLQKIVLQNQDTHGATELYLVKTLVIIFQQILNLVQIRNRLYQHAVMIIDHVR